MFAKDRGVQPHGVRTEKFAALAATADLRKRGGMARGADRLVVATAGDLWVKYEADGSEQTIACGTGEVIAASVLQIARGNPAKRVSAAGSYPAAALGGKTMVVRLDESDDLDGGADVTVTFENSDTTQALILARVNAALNAALPEPGGHPPRVFATDEGGNASGLSSRGRGTGATAEIVSIHADVATATGWSAGTTNGTNFAGPADNVTAYW